MIPERESLVGPLPLLLNLEARLFVGAMWMLGPERGTDGLLWLLWQPGIKGDVFGALVGSVKLYTGYICIGKHNSLNSGTLLNRYLYCLPSRTVKVAFS